MAGKGNTEVEVGGISNSRALAVAVPGTSGGGGVKVHSRL